MTDPPLRLAVLLGAANLAPRLAGLPGIELVADPTEADAVLAPPPARTGAEPLLTAREQEVLALLAEGASNKVIARRLGISPHTAKFHVGQVLEKLDATGRADAVAHAARRGVIQL